MEKITDKEGVVYEFEPLSFLEKNLRKVNLNTTGRTNGEGIWVVLSDNDLKKYDNSGEGEKFVCMLSNDALIFYPMQSWGLHILAEFRGTNRPVANMLWVNYDLKENRIWSPEVPKEKQL